VKVCHGSGRVDEQLALVCREIGLDDAAEGLHDARERLAALHVRV